MPELPEVETIVRGLKREVVGKRISNVWTDWPRHFSRSPGGFKNVVRDVRGAKVINVSRIGKNIIFELSNDRNMLVHLKMTGRLLLVPSSLAKPYFKNIDPYIHTMFCLSGKKSLAFSDVRKFGKVLSVKKSEFVNLPDIKNLGTDALKIKFDELKKALLKRRIQIKKALLDQKVMSGIGNIYADEILFTAGVHPLKKANLLTDGELKKLLKAAKKILTQAIRLRGTSMSDYKDIHGQLGNYYDMRLVYARVGEKCPRCKTKIQKIKLAGRSSHFCGKCQIN